MAWADSPERYRGIRLAVGRSTLVAMSMSIGALRGAGERRGTVDHGFARRMLVNEYQRGRLSREQVCDAHPELIRAAKHVGTPLDQPCPICEELSLRLVTYVFGRPPAGSRALCLDGQGDGDAQPAARRARCVCRRGVRRRATGTTSARSSRSEAADRTALGHVTPLSHAGGMFTSRRYTRPVIFTLPLDGAPRSQRRPGPKGGCHA